MNSRLLVLSRALFAFTLLSPVTTMAGNPEFIPSPSGIATLKLEAVDVGGVKAYQNVELQLDMNNGTFKLVKASLADLRIPEKAVAEVSNKGVTVGLRGCSLVQRSVTCHFIFTAIDFDKRIRFYATSNYDNSGFFDDKGNVYLPALMTLANLQSDDDISAQLIANTPTAVTLRFNNVSAAATGISLFLVRLNFGTNNHCLDGIVVFADCADYEFRNVKF